MPTKNSTDRVEALLHPTLEESFEVRRGMVTHVRLEMQPGEAILPILVRANGMEATGTRWAPEPERYPGTQMQRWFFRLESAKRAGSDHPLER